MKNDAELLRDYAEEASEGAFSELVGRYIDLVYAAALRRTGDSHFAADVTQEVFIYLAREARRLSKHPALAAWLHTATRNAAINLMTSERRRRVHESRAATLALAHTPEDPAPDWQNIRPVLDAAIDALPGPDRVAIVLRFLNRQSFAAVGAALQVSEDAARMRTERALDKLRSGLSRRGISSTAAALGLLVSGQAALSAPAGLAATAASTALASAAAGGLAATGISTLIMTTTQKTLVAAALIASLGTIGYQFHQASVQTDAIASVRNENVTLRRRAWDAEKALVAARQESEGTRVKPLSLEESTEKPSATTVGNDSDAKWLEHLQFLARLKEEGISPTTYTMVQSGQTEVSDSFAKLFRLTTQERNILNQTFQETWDKMGQLAADNSTVSTADNGFVVTVNAFKEQGQALRDQVRGILASTLGPERFKVFASLNDDSGNGLDRLFDFWGDGTHTIAFRHNSPGSTDGEFRILETTKSGSSGSGSSQALASPFALPMRLRWLAPRAQQISELPPGGPAALSTGTVSVR